MTIREVLNPRRSPFAAVVVVSLLIIVAMGVKARVWRHSASANGQQLLSVELGPVQMVRFTLYDAGIFPREARVSPGLVAITLDDVSANSAGLVVQNEARQLVGQVVRGERQWRGSSRMALGPGRYQVFDASTPVNRATLIVEP